MECFEWHNPNPKQLGKFKVVMFIQISAVFVSKSKICLSIRSTNVPIDILNVLFSSLKISSSLFNLVFSSITRPIFIFSSTFSSSNMTFLFLKLSSQKLKFRGVPLTLRSSALNSCSLLTSSSMLKFVGVSSTIKCSRFISFCPCTSSQLLEFEGVSSTINFSRLMPHKAMASDDDTQSNATSAESSIPMSQLMELLKNLTTTKPPENTKDRPIHLSTKLNDQNYTVWSKLMTLAIKGRRRLKHITAPPPPEGDPSVQRWQEADSTVITWIIENIEPDLVTQYLDYPTARELWKGIEATYHSGRDQLQIYDLTVKGYNLKQGDHTIEKYYNNLQAIWKEVDRRMPNPMMCSDDISTHNKILQQNRLFQFLQGIDDSFDKDRRDLLKEDPLPRVETAYATIRREIARRGIMNRQESLMGKEPSCIGSGLVVRGRSDTAKARSSFQRNIEDKTHMKCTHCGGLKHTKEGCFKLIGYPEWWPDEKRRGKRSSAVANATTAIEECPGFQN